MPSSSEKNNVVLSSKAACALGRLCFSRRSEAGMYWLLNTSGIGSNRASWLDCIFFESDRYFLDHLVDDQFGGSALNVLKEYFQSHFY